MNITIENKYLQNTYKRLGWLVVLVPTIGTLLGLGLLLQFGISSWEIWLLVGMYFLTALGLEVGFHRYFSHHAFQTTTTIRIILAILGSMAAGGGVVYWAAHHRRHHQYADRPGDVHSPYVTATSGIGNRLGGLWHAHVGWIFQGEISNSMLFAKDLLRDPIIVKINQLHLVWVALGLLIPAVIGGMITATWSGVWGGLLWGGLVRIFLVHHFIWSTNSICHAFGSRPFVTGDRSTNNLWLALPTLGQSWHNNHHAFPNSAIVGLHWWQIDLGAWVIRALETMGLVWNVKRPKPTAIESKKIKQ
ncbi:acyl-CoA desaturase [Pleurocapsales cyanobacterium LEGE 10410]|nr:acyl-CoA desaturase [Pleurocapsales cyanobacterium LEGE 10410]